MFQQVFRSCVFGKRCSHAAQNAQLIPERSQDASSPSPSPNTEGPMASKREMLTFPYRSYITCFWSCVTRCSRTALPQYTTLRIPSRVSEQQVFCPAGLDGEALGYNQSLFLFCLSRCFLCHSLRLICPFFCRGHLCDPGFPSGQGLRKPWSTLCPKRRCFRGSQEAALPLPSKSGAQLESPGRFPANRHLSSSSQSGPQLSRLGCVPVAISPGP
jgi:hypothetical protein